MRIFLTGARADIVTVTSQLMTLGLALKYYIKLAAYDVAR